VFSWDDELYYTVRGMVLLIAHQGIYLNRTENQSACFIARQGIHRLVYGSPDGEQEKSGTRVSIDMVPPDGECIK
jgi:hypothetical protein